MEDHLEIQWATHYVLTQPAYLRDQLLWNKVTAHLNMTREWHALVRTAGADGDTLHLSIVSLDRRNNAILPDTWPCDLTVYQRLDYALWN